MIYDFSPSTRQRSVLSLAALATAVLLCSGCTDQPRQLAWRQRISIQAHDIAVQSIRFSRDSKRLLTGACDLVPPYIRVQRLGRAPSELSVLDARDGLKQFGVRLPTENLGPANLGAAEIAYGEKSVLAVVFDEPSRILRYDASNGKAAGQATRPRQASFGATVSGDGRWIAWRCGRQVQVWDDERNRLQKTIDVGHEWSEGILAFSDDGRRLAAISYEFENAIMACQIAVWDIRSGERMSIVHCPETPVWLPPVRDRMATCNRGRVAIWDATTGRLLREIETGDDEVNCMAFSPDGCSLVTHGRTEKRAWAKKLPLVNISSKWRDDFKLWDVAAGSLRSLTLDEDIDSCWQEVSALAFSSDGRLLAAGDYSGRVRLWELPSAILSAPGADE